MAISAYSELVTAAGNWLSRSDLDARIPEFIALAEARFRRVLPTIESEVTDDLTVNAETVALPADYLQLRAIHLDTDPRKPLDQMTLAALRTFYAAQTVGEPQAFALTGSSIVFGPAPDAAYTAKITYLAKLTPLTDASPTNWLLADHPDIYLYAVLLQAEFYGWDDERLPMIKAALDEAIAELTAQSNRKRSSASPQRLRSSVIEVL